MKKILDGKRIRLFKLEIALILTGVVIILISGMFENYQNNSDKDENMTGENKHVLVKSADVNDYSAKYEEQIEKILSNIDGIGNVTAAVYVKTEGTVSPAFNIDVDNSVINEKGSDGSNAEEKKNIRGQAVVIIKDAHGNEDVFCTGKTAPEIEGIAVCVEGGLNNVLKEKILSTLTALYNISSTKVSIIG